MNRAPLLGKAVYTALPGSVPLGNVESKTNLTAGRYVSVLPGASQESDMSHG
ncbi:hypothetical protein [Oculatella sp. LEGE 06141]|uniref:hypothetical protein n=1 Tax=Oculatella sp. LEGE 06141 TaxID=1828648 RepID=UPI00187F315A